AHRAEQHPGERAVPAVTHDQQIGLPRGVDQHLRGVPVTEPRLGPQARLAEIRLGYRLVKDAPFPRLGLVADRFRGDPYRCLASRACTRTPVAVASRAAQPSARTDSAEPSTPTTTSSRPLPSLVIALRLPAPAAGPGRRPGSHTAAAPRQLSNPAGPDPVQG